MYSAGPGGVWIFSPDGKHLGTIAMPEPVGNLAWGAPDHKTLYIAASTSIYRISPEDPRRSSTHPLSPLYLTRRTASLFRVEFYAGRPSSR